MKETVCVCGHTLMDHCDHGYSPACWHERCGCECFKARGQTRRQSMIEAIVGTAIGLLVAILSNLIVLPAFGYLVSVYHSIGIALVFTAISILRGYLVRRMFNKLHR